FDVKVVDYAVGVKISEHIWQVEYLKGQSTTTLSWSWTADPGGWHSFEVFVDSGYAVQEENENNNTLQESLYITPNLPELRIDNYTGISFDQPTVAAGNPVKITATIYNDGTLDAFDVEVRFYWDNPDKNGDYLLDAGASAYYIGATLLDVGWGTWNQTSTSYTPLVDGNYTFYVWVDPLDGISERYIEDTNNLARSNVFNVTPRANLTVSAITLSDDTPMEGAITWISATVSNLGGSNASETFDVTFTIYQVTTGSVVFSQTKQITALNASESKVSSISCTPTTHGYHRIIVEVDPAGAVTESIETDNTLQVDIVIYNATLDLIVNNANSPYIIDTFPRKTGFVLVEESGNLTIRDGGGLTIAQAGTNQHTFVVRENGVVNLDGAEISTNNYAMWMYLRDNAVLRANSTALPST
ncbi:MAG: CARDB domain-containing protein, partial [Candidatus Thermoplasmatota archaeon]